MTDALQEAIDMVVRDKEKHYAGILPAEDMLVAYIKVNALAAIAQAEQLKRIADLLDQGMSSGTDWHDNPMRVFRTENVGG